MKIELKNSFITDNSKECEPNSYFVKTKLNASFEKQAIEKQARICSVKEAMELMGIYKLPKLIGITGTNGKTTTACAIYSFLLDLKKSVALCGTRGFFINEKQIATKGLTTPVNLQLLAYIRESIRHECEYFVMEVSSHAITQERIEALPFHARVFTNLSQDHLDYHKNMQEYKKTKESFFSLDGLKLINADELGFKYNHLGAITYGIENPALYRVVAYGVNGGINARVEYSKKSFDIQSQLQGSFNLYNLLAAAALVNELERPQSEDLEEAIFHFGGVKGRMEEISPEIFIDFAHTPDGIEKVLNALKHRPLIVVLGAGGDRDKSKRALMGKIAWHFAKALVITSDNPRFEDPNSIIKDLISKLGNEKLYIEPDRALALALGLSLKKKGEYLVVLGKGDEQYQEIRGEKLPFSDEVILKKLINAKKS